MVEVPYLAAKRMTRTAKLAWLSFSTAILLLIGGTAYRMLLNPLVDFGAEYTGAMTLVGLALGGYGFRRYTETRARVQYELGKESADPAPGEFQ